MNSPPGQVLPSPDVYVLSVDPLLTVILPFQMNIPFPMSISDTLDSVRT